MKLFESIKRRFIDKECRHICLFCEFKHTCDISPYRDKFLICWDKIADKYMESAYNNGFADGCDSGFNSGYEQALQDYDITP